jgi:hypothetical protein
MSHKHMSRSIPRSPRSRAPQQAERTLAATRPTDRRAPVAGQSARDPRPRVAGAPLASATLEPRRPSLVQRGLPLAAAIVVAAAAAMLWPLPVHAAAGERIARAAAGGAAVPDLAAANGEGASARTALAESVALGEDLIVVGPAESTRLIEARLRQAFTPSPRFVYRGADQAVREVAEGRADAAIVAVPFEQITADSSLRELTLASFVVALVTHPDNAVADVSHDQLVNLGHGRVRGWADLGGDRRPLHAYSTFGGPTDEARALGLAQGVLDARDRGLAASQILARVGRDRDALGIVALREVPESLPCIAVDGVRPSASAFASGAYPMGFRLRLVHRASPRAPMTALLDYLRGDDGQRLLRDLNP